MHHTPEFGTHATTQPGTAAGDTLDTQLDAYSRRAGRRGRRKSGAAEVLGYTAAAGGLAFAGGDALGAIVHNSTGTTLSVSNSYKDFGIDIDGVGGDDWNGRIGANAYGAFARVNSLGGTVAAHGGLTPPAIDLSYGFSVGPTLASGVFNDRGVRWYRYAFATADGPFFNSTTGYLGLRFDGDTGAVGTQYAWVKVHFDFAALKLTMNILEWAYDDCGDPITVGAISGGRNCATDVPVPPTPLLTLLGLGALGVTAYRRRRDEGLKRLAEEQDTAAA